jgi:putative transposase
LAKLPHIPRTVICESLGYNRSSGYYCLNQPDLDKPWLEKIRTILKHNPKYGIKRLRLAFKLEGLNISESKLRRICRANGIWVESKKSKPPSRDRGLTPSPVPNLLRLLRENDLIQKPDQVWCGDFSYFNVQGSWYYLATVMDIYTKEILGFSLAQNHEVSLIVRTLNMALNQAKNQGEDREKRGRHKRRPRIFHSDQGSEYTSLEYRNLLAKLNIRQSHSGKASPWENGCQESFYGKLKDELDLRQLAACRNYMELYNLLASQIDYYNNRRIHTTIENIPRQFYHHFLGLQGENNLSKKLGG